MEIFRYQFLLWQLIAAADSGKYDDLTVDQVHYACEENADKFMRTTFSDFDFSMMSTKDWTDLKDAFSRIQNATDYGRKFGIKNNRGLPLVMAFVLQCMQMDEGSR